MVVDGLYNTGLF